MGCDEQGRYPTRQIQDDESDRPIPGAGPVLWLWWGVTVLAYVAALFWG